MCRKVEQLTQEVEDMRANYVTFKEYEDVKTLLDAEKRKVEQTKKELKERKKEMRELKSHLERQE